ncbi:MAG: MtrB/PioB family outer membrane beta-barrel protein, partial [bacterium]
APMPGSTQSPNPTPLSQPLDNQSWEVYLDGGYSFTPTTRGTFKVKYGKATMDEQLPSWSLTGPNAPSPFMPQSMGGRVDTTLLQAGITSRPMPKLSLVANLRYYDMDDRTPIYLVIDDVTGNGPVHNTPQSIATLSGKVEATYRLPMGFSVIGTIDGKDQNRSVPQFEDERYVAYRTDLKEWNYGIQLRRGLSETINGSLSYVYSKRDGGSYSPTNHPTPFAENQITPWNVADRTRDKLRLKLDWTPADNLTLTGVAEGARDDYDHDASRPYGMTDGKAQFYSVDATVQMNDDWQLVGYYAYDEQRANRLHGRWQRTGMQFFEGFKDASLKDKNDTLGASLTGKISSKWKIGADVLWTKNRSSYNESWNPSGLGGDQNRYPGAPDLVVLPDIKTELTRFRFYADYAIQKNGSLRLDVIYENWRTNEWAYSLSDGSPYLYGTATGSDVDGTFFTQDSPQESTFVGLTYKYMLD